MFSLLAPIGILLVGTLVTRRTIAALVAAVVAAVLIQTELSPQAAATLLGSTVAEVLLDLFNIKLLVFILLVGVFTSLVEHSGIARAFELATRSSITSVKRAELFAALTAFPLGIDDYFNSLTRSLLVRDACDHAGIPRRRVSYLVHATALALPTLLPISTAALFVIGLLRGIPSIQSRNAMGFYLSLVPALAFPAFATCVSIACAWPRGATDHRLAASDSEEMALADARPMIWAVGALFLGTLLALPVSGFIYGARDLEEMLVLADVSGALLSGVVLGITTAALLAIRRFAQAPKTLAQLGWRGAREMSPVLVMILLSWLLGKMTNHAIAGSSLLTPIFDDGSLPQEMLPGVIFLASALFTFVMGGAWSAWAVLVPLLVPQLAMHAPELLLVGTAALLSGVVFGETLCPFSDLSILISQSLGISVGDHVAASARPTIVAATAALAAHLTMGLGSITCGVLVGALVLVAFRPWRL